MLTFDLDICFNNAIEAVSRASLLVKEGFTGTKKVENKSATYDLVTEYDQKVEVFLIDFLSKKFPTHKFIGEETTVEKKNLTEEPTWIIDPIDGTSNFVHGFPHIGISVALAVNKEIVIGIVCNPITDQTYTAIKGRGAFLNGLPLHVSKTEELERAFVGLEISLAQNEKIHKKFVNRYKCCVSKVQGIRSIGSAQISLCTVATGGWDAYQVDNLYPWDVAAGSIIIKEAGGVVMDITGEKFDVTKGRILTAGTEKLAHSLLKVFKEADNLTSRITS